MKKDVVQGETDILASAMGNLYDQMFLSALSQQSTLDEMMFGKITGYRNVKVPKYFTIKVPVLSKAYDDDSEYGTGEFEGWLISFREVKLFKIGHTIEKQPIRKKPKGEKVVWKRYVQISGIDKSNLK